MKSVHDFEAFSEDNIECPYPFYAAMQNEAPVFEASRGVFFVSTHEHINQALRDTETFMSGNGAAFLNFQGEQGLAPATAPPQEIIDIAMTGQPPRDTLLSADPPHHARFRRLVNPTLSPRRINSYEPIIRKVCNDLIDSFINDGECELVEQYSMMVPLTVVSLALGVPDKDLARYKDWSIRSVAILAGKISFDQVLDGTQAAVDLQNYIADRVEAARLDPEDNVIGDLVNAHILADEEDATGDAEEYRPLDTPEIVSIVQQLLVAGQETVNYLISSLLLTLLQNPDQLDKILADRSLIGAMIEEGLRTESPIQALGRFATKDTELAGTHIPAGSRVIMMYGCANRDEGVFEKSDSFELHRDNIKDHVAFGAGPHYCVGATLARLESRVAFEVLFDRLANIRLAEGKNDFTHSYNFIFRALKALHIKFEKA